MTCSICKNEMRNATFGSKCEDCWVDAQFFQPKQKLDQELIKKMNGWQNDVKDLQQKEEKSSNV